MHLVHMGCFLLISLADGSPFKKIEPRILGNYFSLFVRKLKRLYTYLSVI